MNRNKVIDLALGVVAVVLVYALMKKPAAAASGNTSGGFAPLFSMWNPANPNEGQSPDPANPGGYIPLSELVKGAVHDLYYGDSTAQFTSIADIQSSLSGDYSTGNAARDAGSVVFKPNGYTW